MQELKWWELGLGWDSTIIIWLCCILHGLLIATRSNIPCTGSVFQVHIAVSHFLCKHVSFWLLTSCLNNPQAIIKSWTYCKQSKMLSWTNLCIIDRHSSQFTGWLVVMCSCMHYSVHLCAIISNISKYNPYHIWRHFLQPLNGPHS